MVIENKTFLVTGGSEGIGFACAEALTKRGANVCITARNADKLAAASQRLPRGQSAAFPSDVRNANEISGAVDAAYREWGRLDGVVHAAGVSMRRPEEIGKLPASEYRRIMETNTDGAFYTLTAAIPYLETREEAFVVLISSTAAHHAGKGNAPYSASKYALRALAETMIAERRGTGIRISTISPGPVSSSIWTHKDTPPAEEDIRRMLAPEDIADIALFLIERPGYVHIEDIKVTPWYF